MSFLPIRSFDAAWNPLNEQFTQPDTTFLFDPAGDATAGLTPGYGGLLTGQNPPNIVTGKYRQGVNPGASLYSYLYMPIDGILGTSQFTVEFWATLTTDWASASSITLLTIGGPSNINFGVNSGSVTAQLIHQQNPASPSSYSLSLSKTITGGQYPANTWTHVALTLSGGVVTLYLNGVNVKQVSGFVSPTVWGAVGPAGLWLPSNSAAQGSTSVTISDLRISRQARIPNTASIVSTNTTNLTVGSVSGGVVNSLLAGGLHGLPSAAADSIQASSNVEKIIRQDKLTQITPMATSSSSTTPTAGQSGVLWYDWTAVDVALAYIYGTLGCQMYLALGGCPQLLGGSVAPWSGSQLTQNICKMTFNYDATVPNNMALWGAMCADFVNHITVEKGYTLNYMGMVNEPDGGTNTWNGTVAQWLSLWAATYSSVKAVNPSIKLCGPETSNWAQAKTIWIQALINYSGQLPTTTGFNATPQGSGGTFSASTYYWKIVGYNGSGNNLPSAEINATIVANGSCLLKWTATPGATTYTIYRSTTSGGETTSPALVAMVAGSAIAYTDTGASTTPGSAPTSAIANSYPPDCISYHYYSGDLSEFTQAANQIAVWATAAGISTPQIINGEWNWDFGVLGLWPWYIPGGVSNTNTIEFVQVLGAPTGGTYTLSYAGQTTSVLAYNANPTTVKNALAALSSIGTGNVACTGQAQNIVVTFQGTLAGQSLALMTANASGLTGGTNPTVTVMYTQSIDYVRNDWAAAWTGSALIEMQRNNVALAIQCNPRDSAPNNCDQWFDAATSVVQPAWNVMAMWSMMAGSQLLSVPLGNTPDPGIHVVAAKNTGTGKVYVFLTSLHYRKTQNYPVLVNVAAAGVADGTAVMVYLVDDVHSNAWDAGSTNAGLQTGSTTDSTGGFNTVSGGNVGIVLRPRAAALLVIG